MPITTTLNRILEHGSDRHLWSNLLAGLGKTKADDEPLPYARIAEINGINFALWACRAEPSYARKWRLYIVWCARQVEHLTTDQRSRDALDISERYANREATEEELAAAGDAAGEAVVATWTAARDAVGAAAWIAGDTEWDAAWAAAGDAAGEAVVATWLARDAVGAAARDAAWAASWAAWSAAWVELDTAGDAAWVARDTAWAAALAATDAAGNAGATAWAAARAAQKAKFIEMCNTTNAR